MCPEDAVAFQVLCDAIATREYVLPKLRCTSLQLCLPLKWLRWFQISASVVPVFNSSSVIDSVVGLSSLLLTVNSTIFQKHICETCFRTSRSTYPLFDATFSFRDYRVEEALGITARGGGEGEVVRIIVISSWVEQDAKANSCGSRLDEPGSIRDKLRPYSLEVTSPICCFKQVGGN